MFSKTLAFSVLTTSLLTCLAAPSDAAVNNSGESRLREGAAWRQGDWKDRYWESPCEIKIEYKRNEFRRNMKCEGGMLVVNQNDRPTIPPGASWRGGWTREFRDGPCMVKQEAKGDEFQEEVRCDRKK